MLEFLRLLFDSSDFPARWHCGTWSDLLGWTHIVADTVIFLSYLGIPVALAWFVMRRGEEAPFPRVAWLFVAFIVSCGVTHLIEAAIFWEPVYRLSAVAKVVTAIVSLTTLLAMIRVLPVALTLPGAHERNAELRAEMEERARVTEALRRSEEQLLRANDDLRRFATVASHDLRAPLRGIRSLAEWVREDGREQLPDESQEHLDLMIARLGRMSDMVEGLLAYARADVDTTHEPFLLSEVVRDAWDLASDAGTTMTLHTEGLDVYAGGSRAGLQQVLRNLMQNARRHHDRDAGSLSVIARTTDDGLRIVVEDDGPGVPEEAAERVFELFRTLEPQDSERVSGLGLALVRRVARQVGGDVVLEPTPGRGARFVVSWPRAEGT